MKILVVCDLGINRSVTLASQLKFLGHDTIAIGLQNSSLETRAMLGQWADLIILTDPPQVFTPTMDSKVQVWLIGPDNYPRPYNKDLLRICRRLIAEHPEIRL